ncbi:hypothetical protein AWB75_06715 [Caballeronia catudaia]|uniref:Uncharacterized protein n=1 Tax=Caballeronia catudaia TaxID=1777136 RepID=A0A158DGM5_9BURK|nr:hypothetical protein AWB75_06715 [Caballeronia catudaia]
MLRLLQITVGLAPRNRVLLGHGFGCLVEAATIGKQMKGSIQPLSPYGKS